MIDIISWVCLVSGGVFLLIGALGLLRFPDFFSRLHAASVIETLGSMLLVTGMLFQAGFSLVSVKLILMIVFIMFTTPTAAHALAKAALHGKLKPLTVKDDES